MSKRSSLWLIPLLVGLVAACSHSSEQSAPTAEDPKPPVVTSENPRSADAPIEIVWTEEVATHEEAIAIRAFATDAWEALSRLLRGQNTPKRRILVHLTGDAQNGEVPTVDPGTGDILLVRFPGADGGYEASLAHEMVHAFRWELWTQQERQTDAFLFLEEGFAEAAAMQIGHPSRGFPNFGAPTSVAAGAFLSDDPAADILALIHSHRELNFRCMAQAYTLRLSFVKFLVHTYGFEELQALAYAPSPLAPETIGEHFGLSLSALANQWSVWASRQLSEQEDANARIASYLEGPIKYLPKCESVAAVARESGSSR